jgi:hypothetical protein
MAEMTLIPLRTLQKWEIGERTPPTYVQRYVLEELKWIRRQTELDTELAAYIELARQKHPELFESDPK